MQWQRNWSIVGCLLGPIDGVFVGFSCKVSSTLKSLLSRLEYILLRDRLRVLNTQVSRQFHLLGLPPWSLAEL